MKPHKKPHGAAPKTNHGLSIITAPRVAPSEPKRIRRKSSNMGGGWVRG